MIDIVEYKVNERNGTITVKFRVGEDSDSVLRNDTFDLTFIEDYGFDIFQKETRYEETYISEDFDDEDAYAWENSFDDEINEQILNEFGYKKTTIQKIADACGISKGHITFYFKKKRRKIFFNILIGF